MMRLTSLYARALYQASTDDEEAVRTREELAELVALFSEMTSAVRVLNHHPEAFKDIRSLLEDDYSRRTLNFIQILADDGMLHRLETITEDYEDVLVQEGVLSRIRVESSRELSTSLKDRLTRFIESKWGQNHELAFVVNPDLVGGLRLTVNGEVFDASLRSRLDQIRREV